MRSHDGDEQLRPTRPAIHLLGSGRFLEASQRSSGGLFLMMLNSGGTSGDKCERCGHGTRGGGLGQEAWQMQQALPLSVHKGLILGTPLSLLGVHVWIRHRSLRPSSMNLLMEGCGRLNHSNLNWAAFLTAPCKPGIIDSNYFIFQIRKLKKK